jgi:hypothetical protein
MLEEQHRRAQYVTCVPKGTRAYVENQHVQIHGMAKVRPCMGEMVKRSLELVIENLDSTSEFIYDASCISIYHASGSMRVQHARHMKRQELSQSIWMSRHL